MVLLHKENMHDALNSVWAARVWDPLIFGLTMDHGEYKLKKEEQYGNESNAVLVFANGLEIRITLERLPFGDLPLGTTI
jgi:hypothetical protein